MTGAGRRGAVGLAGASLGNLLMAVGTVLGEGVSLFVWGQLAAAAVLALIARSWYFDEAFAPEDRPGGRYLPWVLVVLGAAVLAIGIGVLLAGATSA